MQQRQLRLGDVLDDYCPRERRVTDHAIVAMVGDVIKQTRCTACENEHEYKHGKAPTLRKKKEAPSAFAEVAAGMPDPKAPPQPAHGAGQDESMTDRANQSALRADQTSDPVAQAAQGADPSANGGEPAPHEPEAPAAEPEEEGPVHRRLIRATLPRQEGQPPAARPLPDFTVRRPGNRPGGFPSSFRDRGGHGGQRNANGSRPGGGGFRNAGPKSDFGRPGRGDGRPGRRGHGPRRGGGGGGGKKH